MAGVIGDGIALRKEGIEFRKEKSANRGAREFGLGAQCSLL